jgi:VanZ family protein
MLPLRYPWLWATLGWGMVLAVLAGSLAPADMIGDYRISDKLMHAGAYFALMVWFAGFYRRGLHGLIALVLVALGAGVELAQAGLHTRQFDVLDMIANAAGIAIGLALSFFWLAGWCQHVERRWLT